MTSLLVSIGLALAVGSTGQYAHHQGYPRWTNPPGPGYGWGFPNGNPDGYGFWDPGVNLPLGLYADRTSDYYFRRYFSVPVDQMFLPNYYNPYVGRGQRYLTFAGCAPGFHPAGGPALGAGNYPEHPYNDTLGSGPQVTIPSFSGRVEAPPVNSGGTGLTP